MHTVQFLIVFSFFQCMCSFVYILLFLFLFLLLLLFLETAIFIHAVFVLIRIFHFSASAGVIVCRLCVFLERRLYSKENRVSLEEPLQNLCVCSVSLILWRIPASSAPLSLGFSVQAAFKCSQRKIKTCSHAHDANCFVIVASIAPSDSVFWHSPTMKWFFLNTECPFQEPKLEVPYMRPNYLHFRILDFPFPFIDGLPIKDGDFP